MSKDIHEVQMDVMEWMEITDLKEMIRQSKQAENERKIAMQADTLNAVVLALRCRGTNHGKRMKGIAQGLLQASPPSTSSTSSSALPFIKSAK